MASEAVEGIGGIAIVVVAIGRRNGSVGAGAGECIVGIGSIAIVVVAIEWRNGCV